MLEAPHTDLSPRVSAEQVEDNRNMMLRHGAVRGLLLALQRHVRREQVVHAKKGLSPCPSPAPPLPLPLPCLCIASPMPLQCPCPAPAPPLPRPSHASAMPLLLQPRPRLSLCFFTCAASRSCTPPAARWASWHSTTVGSPRYRALYNRNAELEISRSDRPGIARL